MTTPTSAGPKFGADETHWTFLTGDAKTLSDLDRDAFKLGVTMDHSTRFVLIDKKQRIRGYYGITDGDPVARIARDADVQARSRQPSHLGMANFIPIAAGQGDPERFKGRRRSSSRSTSMFML